MAAADNVSPPQRAVPPMVRDRHRLLIAPQSNPGRRWKWPRRLRLTRDGKYFVGITIGVGFAAINTGNNLLYLLLGMMLSLIVVSGILSELTLRGLTVHRRLPARAHVGRSHLVEIEVFNHKRFLPSFAIEVEDLRAEDSADKRCFFLKIATGSIQVAVYRRMPSGRGLEHYRGFRVGTRFPFGLFEKSRQIDAPAELLVYPAVDPVVLPQPRGGALSGESSSHIRGEGDDIYSVRPWREGDEQRDIYWRKSSQQLILRERSTARRQRVTLSLQTNEEARTRTDYEARIRQLASRVVAHVKRGDTIALELEHRVAAHASPEQGADAALRALALAPPGITS